MKKRIKLTDIPMGQVVTFYKYVQRCSRDNRVYWYEYECTTPIAGWVVGIRWLREGIVRAGQPGDYTDETGFDRYLEVDGVVPVLLVVPYPTHAPWYIPIHEPGSYAMGGEPKRKLY